MGKSQSAPAKTAPPPKKQGKKKVEESESEKDESDFDESKQEVPEESDVSLEESSAEIIPVKKAQKKKTKVIATAKSSQSPIK